MLFDFIDKFTKDIDGRELKFLGDNRPARRFLYFRYIMTYLYYKKLGQLQWVGRVEAVADARAIPATINAPSLGTPGIRQLGIYQRSSGKSAMMDPPM